MSRREDEAGRRRHARLIIAKRLDRTAPHPEPTPVDFIAAWLDGDLPIAELSERMGLMRAQVLRMRTAAAEASVAELGRLAEEAAALAAFRASTDDLTEEVVRGWSGGMVPSADAGELIGTDLDGLVRYASAFGVVLPAGVTVAVAPSGLLDSVVARIQKLAGEHPEDDA